MTLVYLDYCFIGIKLGLDHFTLRTTKPTLKTNDICLKSLIGFD